MDTQTSIHRGSVDVVRMRIGLNPPVNGISLAVQMGAGSGWAMYVQCICMDTVIPVGNVECERETGN